jgi:hypothetical protein
MSLNKFKLYQKYYIPKIHELKSEPQMVKICIIPFLELLFTGEPR